MTVHIPKWKRPGARVELVVALRLIGFDTATLNKALATPELE